MLGGVGSGVGSGVGADSSSAGGLRVSSGVGVGEGGGTSGEGGGAPQLAKINKKQIAMVKVVSFFICGIIVVLSNRNVNQASEKSEKSQTARGVKNRSSRKDVMLSCPMPRLL